MTSISKTSVLKEALNRRNTIANAKKLVLRGDFPQQDAFVNDTSRYIAAQCSRRAGKTSGIILRFFKTLEKYPKSQCLYIALTRDSAKEILWQPLQDFNDQYGLGCRFTESKLEMTHPNGAKLRIYGADMKNFIKRLKGRKYPGVAIDESQDFGSHLESLINDVLTPSIADYADGWLALTGTPGPVPNGYFFDVTKKGKYGYSLHKWTIVDNPHMPDAQGFLSDILIKREWTIDHPTYKREYLNEWVLDLKSLWIKYDAGINHYDTLPKEHKWSYILGIDIGFNDADAIAVIAWSSTCTTAYLVEECITHKQGTTALMDQINALQKKYDAYKMVMDEGGLGKKIAEDFRQRYGMPIEPADKAHKQSNVEFLNDAMRLGKFKAKKDSRFALDSYLIQVDWEKSTPSRIIIKKTPHSDIIDAVLYAFRESYYYTSKPEPARPARGTKEWAEAEGSKMFELELEGLKKELEESEYQKWQFGEE